jgi:hypothetical protein
MKERSAQIPTEEGPQLVEAADALVRLYEAWGRPEQAAAWRKRREEEKRAGRGPGSS